MKIYKKQTWIFTTIFFVLSVASCLTLASCLDAGAGGSGGENVTGVSLNKTSTSLIVGGTETLFASVSPPNASNRNVTWSSSNVFIASVSSNGTITAISTGTAIITVRTVDGGRTATCSVTVSATEPEQPPQTNEFLYRDVAGGIEITGYSGSSAIVSIPTQINSKTVVSIGEKAFRLRQITSVTIPNSVISIGEEAFMQNQLTSVTIPNSVTSIGEDAFMQNQLTSVTIPNSVTSIGSGAFYDNRLTTIIIPNSITTIEEHVFSYNPLTNVIIPNSVTSIGSWAFGSNRFTNVIIPNSVTSIREWAFLSNQLTSITIGANVEIEIYSFYDYDIVGNAARYNGFADAYNGDGRFAGTYTRPNTNSTIWTRQ